MLRSSSIGSGPPLLMIHGIMSDGSFFRGLAERLSDQFQVITYDRRGYGAGTEDQYDDFSVKVQAEDAVEVLKRYTSEPAFILGNSAGGLISIEIGLRYPQLVQGMALLEPSLGFTPEDTAKLSAWNEELNGYVAAGRPKRALPAFARVTGNHSGESQPVSLAELKQTYRNLNNFLYGELNEVQHYYPTLEQCRSLPMPVHMLISDAGRESFFATSSLHAAEIIGWDITYVKGYHNAAKDEPDAFAECLRKLLV